MGCLAGAAIQCRVSTATPSTVIWSGMEGLLADGAAVLDRGIQQRAAVPLDSDLRVVGADDLPRLEPVQFLSRGAEQVEGVDGRTLGLAALAFRGAGGDDLVQAEPTRVVDGRDRARVGHRVGVDEAVAVGRLSQGNPGLGQPPVGGRQ